LSRLIQKKKAKQQEQQELIDWRRSQVIQLISKGKNLTQTAEILKVDVSTVCRDYQHIKENANKVLKKYFAETVPLEVTKCLSRLNAISKEAWDMAEKASNEKNKIAALSLAQEAALHIVNVVTNNKPLVDEAFKFASEAADDVEESARAKQGSDSNNIDELSGKDSGSEEQQQSEQAGDAAVF
jgi:hypothetical protein